MAELAPSPPETPRRAAPPWLLLLAILIVGITIATTVNAIQPTRRWVHPASSDWNAAWWEWAGESRDRISLNMHRGTDPHSHAIPNVPAEGELLVFGNSAAREAFDAAAFTAATGVPAYNFGLTTVRVSDFLKAGFTPAKNSTVLLLLNGAAMDDRLRSDPGLPWNAEYALPSIIGERREIAALLSARALEAGRRVVGRAPDPWRSGDRRRLYRYDEPLDDAALAKQIAEVREWYGSPGAAAGGPDSFAHSREDAEALTEIARQAKRDGWRLMVAWIPARSIEIEAVFAAQRVNARASFSVAVPGDEVVLLDGVLEEGDYHDVGHVLASGRAKVTSRLVERWR